MSTEEVMKRIFGIVLTLSMFSILLFSYTHCGKNPMLQISQAEIDALNGRDILDNGSIGAAEYSPNFDMTGVDSDGDSYIPRNLYAQNPEDLQFVKRCCPSGQCMTDFNREKAEAVAAAIADPQNIIPVKFSISTGDKHDSTAYRAYLRTVLRTDSPGVSYISVAPHNVLSGSYYNGSNVKYYIVDHQNAKEKYVKGENCFFSTVKVNQYVQGGFVPRWDGANIYDHSWVILHYGDVYNTTNLDLSPRLFAPLGTFDEPQIIPLYMADFRDPSLPNDLTGTVLSADFASSAIRRKEYKRSYKEVFNLDFIVENKEYITQKLCSSRTVNTAGVNYSYAGYEGCPQIIENLMCLNEATILSLTYTPLVIDLQGDNGEYRNILTSSTEWGTYFNLSNAVTKNGDKNISQKTAWVGGYLEKAKDHNGEDVWVRRAKDGFLVMPSDDGKILTSEQLFGDQTIVNGERFENGFLALRAYGEKDCLSKDRKKQYLGPWDEAYGKLKVWVDANRNGHAEEGELKPLSDHRIAAINSCYIHHKEEYDAFGNETKMRSAVLIVEDGFDFNDHDKIIERLRTGQTEDGSDITFNVMVDILFKSHPTEYLERHASEDIIYPGPVTEQASEGDVSEMTFGDDAIRFVVE